MDSSSNYSKARKLSKKFNVSHRTGMRWVKYREKNPYSEIDENFDIKNFYRVRDIVKKIGTSRSFVYRYYHEGVFKGIKLTPRILLIEKESFHAWLRSANFCQD